MQLIKNKRLINLLEDLHKVLQLGVHIRFDFSKYALIGTKGVVYYRLYKTNGKPSFLMVGVPTKQDGLKVNLEGKEGKR